MQRAYQADSYSYSCAGRLSAGDRELLDVWRRLTNSDHLYYMCTKWFSDGDVHKYFSPYASPHDAFIAFMNVLDDLDRRLEAAATTRGRSRKAEAVDMTAGSVGTDERDVAPHTVRS